MERGRRLLDKGDWEGAIQEFTEALRVNPTNTVALEERAVAYMLQGDLTAALADFSRVIALEPTNQRAHENRANAHLLHGDFAAAVADFSWVITRNPTNQDAYENRAAAYYAQGRWDKAIRDLNECLRLNPTNARAICTRALCLRCQGQFERAVSEFRLAIKVDPKLAYAYNGLAWLRATCSEASVRSGKEAVELAKKACELTHWKEPYFVDTLAAAYAEVGDFDQAVRLQKLALGMEIRSPVDRWWMEERLRLYEQRQPYRDQRLGSRPQNP